jgi:hypothetical protein
MSYCIVFHHRYDSHDTGAVGPFSTIQSARRYLCRWMKDTSDQAYDGSDMHEDSSYAYHIGLLTAPLPDKKQATTG